MANVTTTTAAVFIPEVWARMAFQAAQLEACIADTVNRQFEKDMQFGGTLHIPVGSNLTANNKSASTNVTMQAITETKTDVSINNHKYVAFQVERLPAVQANQDLLKMYTNKIGYPLQRAIETSLSGIFNALSQIFGSLGQEPTWDDFRTGWRLLREAGVAEGNLTGDVTWMLSPAMMAAAFALEVLTSSDYSSSKAAETAKINRVLNWPARTSNLLNSPATGQHDSAVYHRDQFVLVQQDGIHVESDYIIEAIGTAVVADTIYGFAEVGHAPETAGGGSAVDTRGAYFKGV